MNIVLRENCPDCGVAMGGYHSSSCDVDHCRNCGGQLLGMCCDKELGPNIWNGIWPGELECYMYGLFARMGRNGWEKTDANDPDANPDLNTLFSTFKWNKEQLMWEPK
jgi:hypothetical protein